MLAESFTPKQVAQALDVSESSVKRWVDNGRLPAVKTVGGHRKVSLPNLVKFIREVGHELVDPAAVGMVPPARANLEDARDELFAALVEGAGAASRELVLGFYQRGESITDLGDRLVGPVLERVGDEVAKGTLRIYQERQCCEAMMAVLRELRRWMANPAQDAPLAMLATPEQDFAEVPARLVKLTLVSAGWRVNMLGSGLPLEEIRDAALAEKPALLCLSVVHLVEPDTFVERCNRTLWDPLSRQGSERTRLAVGGYALRQVETQHLKHDLLADNLKVLLSYQASLLPSGGPS